MSGAQGKGTFEKVLSTEQWIKGETSLTMAKGKMWAGGIIIMCDFII